MDTEPNLKQHTGQTTYLLGYPPDARLLIINADDLGLCPSVNAAIFATIQAGIVRSTTLMTPCPGAASALAQLRQQPTPAFGVHLTLICDTIDAQDAIKREGIILLDYRPLQVLWQ